MYIRRHHVSITLCMSGSLLCCLYCDRFDHPHPLYSFSNDTDLFNPELSWAALFWNF